ncbi:hypothetical protein [Legionella sainthelensi]|uniref:hypothetical protein n=1 Tax=Legionella sainthelensi TaxID=28087 RepID=UPI000E207012|nr:hypothetical protein [Legionella sainthelensi]
MFANKETEEVRAVRRQTYDKDNTEIITATHAAEVPDLDKFLPSFQLALSEVEKLKSTFPDDVEIFEECMRLMKAEYDAENYKEIAKLGKKLSSEFIERLDNKLKEQDITMPKIFSNPLNTKTECSLVNSMLELYLVNLRHIAKKGSSLGPMKDNFKIKDIHLDSKDIDENGMPVTQNKSMRLRLDAALLIYNETYDDNFIPDLYNKVMSNRTGEGPIYLLNPVKDQYTPGNNCNFLALVNTSAIMNQLNQYHESRLGEKPKEPLFQKALVVNVGKTYEANRTTASASERILTQPIYKYDPPPGPEGTLKNQDVLLIDDHINAGGVSSTVYAFATHEEGANVVGITSMSSHPHLKDISIEKTPEIRAELVKQIGEDYVSEFDETLGKVGLSIDTLSIREALTLLARLMPKEQEDKFTELHNNALQAEVLEGEKDSLIDLFNDEKVKTTAPEWINDINETLAKDPHASKLSFQSVMKEDVEPKSVKKHVEPKHLKESFKPKHMKESVEPKVSTKKKPMWEVLSDMGFESVAVPIFKVAQKLEELSKTNPKQAIKSGEEYLAHKTHKKDTEYVRKIQSFVDHLKMAQSKLVKSELHKFKEDQPPKPKDSQFKV